MSSKTEVPTLLGMLPCRADFRSMPAKPDLSSRAPESSRPFPFSDDSSFRNRHCLTALINANISKSRRTNDLEIQDMQNPIPIDAVDGDDR